MLKKSGFFVFGVFLLINSLVVGYEIPSFNLNAENNTWNFTNFTNLTNPLLNISNISNSSDYDSEDDEPQDSMFNLSDYDIFENDSNEPNISIGDWNVSNVTCPNCTIIICSNCTFNITDLLDNETPTNLTDEISEEEYVEKIYVYGNGLVASKKSDSENINYYHQDYLSSNRVTSNNNGEITGKNTQEPYGSGYEEKGSEEALKNSYKFTGKEEDDSLYYFGARYYEPSSARFISIDPMFNPGISPYVYANDNPLRYVDPDGRQIIFADNLKERATPLIDFMAEHSYSVKELKENDYYLVYSEVERWSDLVKMFGIDPVTMEFIRPKYGYTDIKSMRAFLRPNQKKIQFFHTLAHESMHLFSLTQDKESAVRRHGDSFHALLDEIRVELKVKYEFGLDKPYNPEVWKKIDIKPDDFEKLKKINEKQLEYYLDNLINIVGEESAEEYFDGLDEYIRDKTEKGEWVY